MISAKIHSFESMATKDGEGIRFAVFLSGCDLNCVYCHNPDVVKECGEVWTVDEFIKKAKRFKPYFKNGGGVTFSGGEPLLQADFISEAGGKLKEEGISYLIDTSGAHLTESVKNAVSGADSIILDLKFHNDADYYKHTGGGLDKVLKFGDFIDAQNKRIRLRTVIVPGINDTENDVERYVEIAKRWKNVENYELLAFHTLGFNKYEKLGILNPLSDKSALTQNKLDDLQKIVDKKFNY